MYHTLSFSFQTKTTWLQKSPTTPPIVITHTDNGAATKLVSKTPTAKNLPQHPKLKEDQKFQLFETQCHSYVEVSGQTLSEPSSTCLECTYSHIIQVNNLFGLKKWQLARYTWCESDAEEQLSPANSSATRNPTTSKVLLRPEKIWYCYGSTICILWPSRIPSSAMVPKGHEQILMALAIVLSEFRKACHAVNSIS